MFSCDSNFRQGGILEWFRGGRVKVRKNEELKRELKLAFSTDTAGAVFFTTKGTKVGHTKGTKGGLFIQKIMMN